MIVSLTCLIEDRRCYVVAVVCVCQYTSIDLRPMIDFALLYLPDIFASCIDDEQEIVFNIATVSLPIVRHLTLPRAPFTKFSLHRHHLSSLRNFLLWPFKNLQFTTTNISQRRGGPKTSRRRAQPLTDVFDIDLSECYAPSASLTG